MIAFHDLCKYCKGRGFELNWSSITLPCSSFSGAPHVATRKPARPLIVTPRKINVLKRNSNLTFGNCCNRNITMHSLFHGSPTGFCFLFPLGFFLIFTVTAACTCTISRLCLLLLDLFSYSKALKCAEDRFSCCCCRRCSFTRLLTETSCRRQQCWRVWWKSQQRGPPLLELSVTGRVAKIRKESSTVRTTIWRQQLRELYY